MVWKKHYERWSSFEGLDQDLKDLLKEITKDEKATEDCFYKYLEFGTGGMRGEIGLVLTV